MLWETFTSAFIVLAECQPNRVNKGTLSTVPRYFHRLLFVRLRHFTAHWNIEYDRFIIVRMAGLTSPKENSSSNSICNVFPISRQKRQIYH